MSDEEVNQLEKEDSYENREDWKYLSAGYITPGQQQDKIIGQVTQNLMAGISTD
jgi:hypothetical protein